MISRENGQLDGLIHNDSTALHETMKPRQSVTSDVRSRQVYFQTPYLCFFMKHNCLNFGFTFDSKDDILYKRRLALHMLRHLFTADLEADIPLKKGKNMYFVVV